MMNMSKSLRSLFLFLGLFLASAASANAFTIQEVTSPGGIKAWLVEEHAIPLEFLPEFHGQAHHLGHRH